MRNHFFHHRWPRYWLTTILYFLIPPTIFTAIVMAILSLINHFSHEESLPDNLSTLTIFMIFILWLACLIPERRHRFYQLKTHDTLANIHNHQYQTQQESIHNHKAGDHHR